MTLAIHLCRGNSRSQWLAEGELLTPLPRSFFSQLDVDAFLLEYDTARDRWLRATPIRAARKSGGTRARLVEEFPEIESRNLLKRRIDEASKYVPLENLALSPQCGFASTAEGNLLTQDEQRRKLELVADVAREVWG